MHAAPAVRKRDAGGDVRRARRSIAGLVEPVVAVGLEHGAAEGADDGAPGDAVHGEEVAEPRGRLHVRHAGAAAAPRADPRRRLAAPHLPPLVHQEAEEHHAAAAAAPPPPPSRQALRK